MSVICRVANLSSHIRMVQHTHYFCIISLMLCIFKRIRLFNAQNHTCFDTNNFVDEPAKVWNIFCFCFDGCLVVTCKVYWAVGSTREGLNPNPIVLGFAGLLTSHGKSVLAYLDLSLTEHSDWLTLFYLQ